MTITCSAAEWIDLSCAIGGAIPIHRVVITDSFANPDLEFLEGIIQMRSRILGPGSPPWPFVWPDVKFEFQVQPREAALRAFDTASQSPAQSLALAAQAMAQLATRLAAIASEHLFKKERGL